MGRDDIGYEEPFSSSNSRSQYQHQGRRTFIRMSQKLNGHYGGMLTCLFFFLAIVMRCVVSELRECEWEQSLTVTVCSAQTMKYSISHKGT